MLERIKDFLFGAAPERRHEPRIVAVDGAVEIDGVTYPVRNWSPRGFLVTSCEIERAVKDGLDIRFRAQLGQRMLDVACRAIIVRIDVDRREIVGCFARLDDATMCEIAEHFATSAAA